MSKLWNIQEENFYVASDLLNPSSPQCLAERINQTVEIIKHTVDIEEKGVKLKLTIVDTPGFGDAVNNNEWWAGKQPAGLIQADRFTSLC